MRSTGWAVWNLLTLTPSFQKVRRCAALDGLSGISLPSLRHSRRSGGAQHWLGCLESPYPHSVIPEGQAVRSTGWAVWNLLTLTPAFQKVRRCAALAGLSGISLPSLRHSRRSGGAQHWLGCLESPYPHSVIPEGQAVRSTGWAVWNLLKIAEANRTQIDQMNRMGSMCRACFTFPPFHSSTSVCGLSRFHGL